MSEFEIIEGKDFEKSPFQVISKDWMLITTEKDGVVNTMTASWGAMGIMWNTQSIFTVIRQSRYTREILDQSDSFSVSILNHEKYAKELAYFGSVSGRDENKIDKVGFHVTYLDGIACIDESETVFTCHKMFKQKMEPESILVPEIITKHYADQDYHDLYIGEIIHVWSKKG